MSTQTNERLDLEIIEADLDQPRVVRAYCGNCIDTRPETPSMCGFKKRSSADFVGEEPDGDLCVVCVEAQHWICKVCGV